MGAFLRISLPMTSSHVIFLVRTSLRLNFLTVCIIPFLDGYSQHCYPRLFEEEAIPGR